MKKIFIILVASMLCGLILKAQNPTLNVSDGNIYLTGNANSTATFTITSNINWAITCDQTWLNISPVLGLNNDTVTLTAQANTGSSVRTATITVNGTGVNSQIINITQFTTSSYTIPSSTTIIIDGYSNSTGFFWLYQLNSCYTASSDQSWFWCPEISGCTGGMALGGGMDIWATSANLTGVTRTGILTLSSPTLPSVYITVIQNALPLVLTVSSNALSIAANNNSTVTFDITSNISWTATSNQNWLSLSNSSGSGNTPITLTAQANPTTAPRTSTVTISGIGVTDQTITVTQDASLPVFTVLTDSQNVDAGKWITVSINTISLNTTDNVISYQLDYNYDNTKLEYQNYDLIGTWAENGSIQINNTSNAKLSVAWARQTPIVGTDTGSILNLQFKTLGAGITTPTITNCLFNTDTVKNITNGTITATVKYGDIDGNGYIQAYDAALTIQYSVGLDPIPMIDPIPWETCRIIAANVDGQGGVTAYDASLILQYTVGLINIFPVGKKGGTKDNANVTVSNENGFLVFRSTGDLFGLNVFVNENKQYLGAPQFLNTNTLSATNITTTNYAIGAATAYAPTSGDVFMKIPFYGGQNIDVTFDMIVNSTNLQVTVGLVTGITQINENAILVYPNPANNYLFINGLNENAKISIYDFSGKLLFNKKVANNQIDISNFQSGIYTMKIETAKGIITKKIVKQ